MTALSRHKIRGKLCKRLHSPSNIQSFYLFWVKGDVRGVPSGGRLLRRMGSREALGVSPGVNGLSRGSQVVKGYVRCPRVLGDV